MCRPRSEQVWAAGEAGAHTGGMAGGGHGLNIWCQGAVGEESWGWSCARWVSESSGHGTRLEFSGLRGL